MLFKDLLNQLKEHFDVEDFPIHQKKIVLPAANDVSASLHEVPNKSHLKHRFYLSSTVCVAPDPGRDLRSILSICLEANFFGQGTNGAVFAFNRSTHEVIFFRAFDPKKLNFKLFLRTLEDLVLHVREWRRRFEAKDYYGSWRKNYRGLEAKQSGGLPLIGDYWKKI